MIFLTRNKLLIKYIFVGIMTVLLDYSIIFVFYTILKKNYIISVIMGFTASNIFQFYINFFYTFRLEKTDLFHKRVLMYIVSSALGMLIGTSTIILLESFFHSLYISKTLSLFVSFLYGFTSSKYIVFNSKVRF